MRKFLCLMFLSLAGCSASDLRFNDSSYEGGALVQGSRAWHEHNLCGPDNKSGQCIEAIHGPFALTQIDSGVDCPHSMTVTIMDTYHNANEGKAHWIMIGPPKTQLLIHLDKNIPAGSSLFIGTDGFNDVFDGKCFITWKGSGVMGR